MEVFLPPHWCAHPFILGRLQPAASCHLSVSVILIKFCLFKYLRSPQWGFAADAPQTCALTLRTYREHRQDSWPGEKLCAAVTLSRSFRWSHGLNTSFPSPSLHSFRHCSFSRSIRRYSPYSRPLSAGSWSHSHPQPCPGPWPWPCPDIVALKPLLSVTGSLVKDRWLTAAVRPQCFGKVKRVSLRGLKWTDFSVKLTDVRRILPVRDFRNKISCLSKWYC